MLLITIIVLILGLFILYFGSKVTVLGLENIAERFGMNHMLIGLTIFSVGMSFSEIAGSIIGVLIRLLELRCR